MEPQKVGDRVRCISEKWLSHRKGSVIEITNDGLVELFIVRFESPLFPLTGAIQEKPFIFHKHQLEIVE